MCWVPMLSLGEQLFYDLIQFGSVELASENPTAQNRSVRLYGTLNLSLLSVEYYGFYKNVYSGEIVGLDHATEVFFAYSIIYCTAVSFFLHFCMDQSCVFSQDS